MKKKDDEIGKILILGLALGLIVKSKKNREQGVSGIKRYQEAGYDLQGLEYKKEALEALWSAKGEVSLNDEIVADGEGNFMLSYDLQQTTGLPQFIRTKKDLNTAISQLRSTDRILFINKPSAGTSRENRAKMTRNAIKERFNEQFEPGRGVWTAEGAYNKTVSYIVNGGKFCWNNKVSDSGAKIGYGLRDWLFGWDKGRKGEKHGGQTAEHRAKQQILSEKDGLTVEEFIEQIEDYERREESWKEVQTGVTNALQDINTPNEAFQYMVRWVDNQNNAFFGKSEDLPF